jgi:hypothetical protein
MEDYMNRLNMGVIVTLMFALLTSCSMFKKKEPTQQPQTAGTATPQATPQATQKNQESAAKAASLTSGWPDASTAAAKEMIDKYGEPHETTSDSLVWRNIAPFKKIVVHKVVYPHRFPLLHQVSLEHVVDYKAPIEKVDDVWRYNGSIVLNRTKGEMSSFAENEAMNVLALNLAHAVLTSRMGSDAARTTYGKETLNYMNGNRTAYTQVINFGTQFDTADPGQSVTSKIRWSGDPAKTATQPATQQPTMGTQQAQQEKKK